VVREGLEVGASMVVLVALKEQEERPEAYLLCLDMSCPLPCLDTRRRPSPDASTTLLDSSLQNHESNKLLLFINYLLQVFCYSNREWTKTATPGQKKVFLEFCFLVCECFY
jgi:hypothetical protein